MQRLRGAEQRRALCSSLSSVLSELAADSERAKAALELENKWSRREFS
jgi:hypothetical protein